MLIGLDHLIVTVSDIDASVDFYTRVLGLEARYQDTQRIDLVLGDIALRLHQRDTPASPKAHRPTPGSLDICFRSILPLEEVQSHLEALQIPVELGPTPRQGANGAILSLYLRDPDDNLIEICRPNRL